MSAFDLIIKNGLIFDAFDVIDLANSDPSGLTDTLINARKSPPPAAGINPFVYQNLWVPHWEGTTFTAAQSLDLPGKDHIKSIVISDGGEARTILR